MTASEHTPSSGESVTDVQPATRTARNRFLEVPLQLIRDHLNELKRDLDEKDDSTIRYELQQIRTDLKAVDGMIASDDADEGRPGIGNRFWRCTFCGNVVHRHERPTECFHCRRGESELELNGTRLFLEIETDT